MTNKIDKIQMPDGQVLELSYSELNNPYSLFDSKYSDHELNNLSWLKSEGQWNAKAIYPTAYDKLLNVYNGTETVEGLSVKLSTEIFTDYDFVLNTAEETFRLPLLDGSESLTGDRYDNLELKATNSDYIAPANGWFQLSGNCAQNGYASLTNNSNGLQAHDDSKIANSAIAITLQVSNGDSVTLNYGQITLTQIKFVYAKGNGSLYFYVGETVQNANLIDAGRIGEQLATKTDMLQASSAGMPSGKYIDLSIGATGTQYTAPANGWYNLRGQTTADYGFIELITNTYMNVLSQSTSSMTNAIILPVKKGQVVSLGYNSATIEYFRFHYAEGDK